MSNSLSEDMPNGEKIEYDTAMNSSQRRYFTWNSETQEDKLDFSDRDRVISIPVLNKFKSYSVFSAENIPASTIQMVRLRIIGGTCVKVGVSTTTDVPKGKAYCDYPTGYGLYLKQGQTRHGSKSRGNELFTQLPGRTDELHLTMVINRKAGWLGYSYNGQTRIAFRADEFLDAEVTMHLAVSFLDNAATEVEFADKRIAWQERKAMLFTSTNGKGPCAQLTSTLLREAASFL